MPAFYTQPETLDDTIDFVAGKALDLIGVEHDLLRRWGSWPERRRPGRSERSPPNESSACSTASRGPYDR